MISSIIHCIKGVIPCRKDSLPQQQGLETSLQQEPESPDKEIKLDDLGQAEYCWLYLAEDSSTSALQVLRRSSSIFTSVYVAVQKLKKTLARASVQLG
ncbi:hypothetical protein Tco_0259710 [Tanacetum coccineum]